MVALAINLLRYSSVHLKVILLLLISGFSLMWLVYDIGSSYQWVFFSDSKRAPIILEILRIVLADLKFSSKEMKILRSDAEEIFNSSDVQFFLDKRGIKHQFSVPYENY